MLLPLNTKAWLCLYKFASHYLSSWIPVRRTRADGHLYALRNENTSKDPISRFMFKWGGSTVCVGWCCTIPTTSPTTTVRVLSLLYLYKCRHFLPYSRRFHAGRVFVDLMSRINIILLVLLLSLKDTHNHPPQIPPMFSQNNCSIRLSECHPIKAFCPWWNEPIKQSTSAWAEIHLLMGETRSKECRVRIASAPHYHAANSHHSHQLGSHSHQANGHPSMSFGES